MTGCPPFLRPVVVGRGRVVRGCGGGAVGSGGGADSETSKKSDLLDLSFPPRGSVAHVDLKAGAGLVKHALRTVLERIVPQLLLVEKVLERIVAARRKVDAGRGHQTLCDEGGSGEVVQCRAHACAARCSGARGTRPRGTRPARRSPHRDVAGEDFAGERAVEEAGQLGAQRADARSRAKLVGIRERIAEEMNGLYEK